MDKNSYKVRREQWLRIVTECNSRDQSFSKIQWCRMNGVNIKSFYYWQRQFRNELLIQGSTSATQVPAFVDITSQVFRSAHISKETVSAERTLVPELMIQSGDFRVYVSGTVQEQTLDTVMKVLRHA
jgi:transposase-like protein